MELINFSDTTNQIIFALMMLLPVLSGFFPKLLLRSNTILYFYLATAAMIFGGLVGILRQYNNPGFGADYSQHFDFVLTRMVLSQGPVVQAIIFLAVGLILLFHLSLIVNYEKNNSQGYKLALLAMAIVSLFFIATAFFPMLIALDLSMVLTFEFFLFLILLSTWLFKRSIKLLLKQSGEHDKK